MPRIGPLEEIKHIASVSGFLFYLKRFCSFGTGLKPATSTVETMNHSSENSPTTGALTVRIMNFHLLGLPGHCVDFLVIFFHVVFFCCIFRVVLKALHPLRQIILFYVWQIFLSDSKEEIFIGVGKLGLIHYLVVFLYLL